MWQNFYEIGVGQLQQRYTKLYGNSSSTITTTNNSSQSTSSSQPSPSQEEGEANQQKKTQSQSNPLTNQSQQSHRQLELTQLQQRLQSLNINIPQNIISESLNEINKIENKDQFEECIWQWNQNLNDRNINVEISNNSIYFQRNNDYLWNDSGYEMEYVHFGSDDEYCGCDEDLFDNVYDSPEYDWRFEFYLQGIGNLRENLINEWKLHIDRQFNWNHIRVLFIGIYKNKLNKCVFNQISKDLLERIFSFLTYRIITPSSLHPPSSDVLIANRINYKPDPNNFWNKQNTISKLNASGGRKTRRKRKKPNKKRRQKNQWCNRNRNKK